MKFLCVGCDAQMKTVDTKHQTAEGTMAIVLECPECFSQFGMLTNPMETKVLDSLDVSVCPVGGRGRKQAAEADAPAAATTTAGGATVTRDPADPVARSAVSTSTSQSSDWLHAVRS